MEAIDITKIVVLGIGFLSAIITGFIIPYFVAKTKKTNEETDGEIIFNVKTWVRIAVESAEMIFKTPGAGAEKLDYVMKYIEKHLAEKGLSMDEQQIRMMVESAVLELKKALN